MSTSISDFQKFVVLTPEAHMGDVIGDICRRNGEVLDAPKIEGGMRAVTARLLLSEVKNFQSALSNLTKGTASMQLLD